MTYDRVRAATDAIRSLGGDRVLVGIPAENGGRTPEPGSGEAINNAALGWIHDKGSPAANIPARPFLEVGVREAQEEIADLLESDVRARLTVRGSRRSPEQTLHAVGLLAQNAVRKKITDGPFVALKPATLAKRRKRGRSGTKPLIDTGQLRAAITYVVEGE